MINQKIDEKIKHKEMFERKSKEIGKRKEKLVKRKEK